MPKSKLPAPNDRWEKAAHALCAMVSAEEMEKMGPNWLTRYLSLRIDLSKKTPHK